MTYPTTSGCVGTVAWEAFRETIDDVRYLTLLLKLVARAEKQPDTQQSAGEVRIWLDQLDLDRDLDEVRDELVQKILTLSSPPLSLRNGCP